MVTKTKTKKRIAKKPVNEMTPKIASMEAYKLDYKNIPFEIIEAVSKDYCLFKDFIQKYGLIEDNIIDKLDIHAISIYMEETEYKHITDKMVKIICKDPEYAAEFAGNCCPSQLPDLFIQLVIENKDKKYDRYDTYAEKFIETLGDNIDYYDYCELDNLGLLLLELDPLVCLIHIRNNNYKINVDKITKDKIIKNISKDERYSSIYLLDNINDFKNIPEEIISTVSKNCKSITADLLDRIISERQYC